MHIKLMESALQTHPDKTAVVNGRLELREEYMDMSRMQDDDLRGMRTSFMALYIEKVKEFTALGDNRYATPEGVEVRRDMDYYDGLLRRLECEMACRMLPLA